MTTERIYDRDSYAATFEAEVLACEERKGGFRVALSRTCFFPEGGGQYGDRGVLLPASGAEQMPVIDTHEVGALVWHHTAAPLPVGSRVTGEIDWALRFARMQCHTGEHIVSGLFHRLFGLENVGFHLGDDEMTIDLNAPVTWEDIRRVQRLANEAVAANVPVRCEIPAPVELKGLEYRSKLDLKEDVRIVTIPGYDACACCAPHVARTGEIGLIHLISVQNWKGGVRIRMLCGSRAVADVMDKQESITAISNLLSAKQDHVVAAVRRVSDELEREKARTAALGRMIAQAKVDALPVGEKRLVLFEALDTNALRALVNGAVAKGTEVCAAFAWDGSRFQYILGSERQDMRPLVKEMNGALNGRGGGSAQMVQGSVQAEQAAIEAWWTTH